MGAGKKRIFASDIVCSTPALNSRRLNTIFPESGRINNMLLSSQNSITVQCSKAYEAMRSLLHIINYEPS